MSGPAKEILGPSAFRIEQWAQRERSRAIRMAARACAEWLSVMFRRSVKLAEQCAVELRRRKAARELQGLDDHMLADIGLRRGEIESAVRHGRHLRPCKLPQLPHARSIPPQRRAA